MDKVFESFFKPIQPGNNQGAVYDDGVSHHGEKVEDELLSSMDCVDINRIETALCTSAAGEEEGVDVIDTADAIEDPREYYCQKYDVEVMYSDEIELFLGDHIRNYCSQGREDGCETRRYRCTGVRAATDGRGKRSHPSMEETCPGTNCGTGFETDHAQSLLTMRRRSEEQSRKSDQRAAERKRSSHPESIVQESKWSGGEQR